MLHDVTPYVRADTITPTGRSALEVVPRSPGGWKTDDPVTTAQSVIASFEGVML